MYCALSLEFVNLLLCYEFIPWASRGHSADVYN